MKALIAKILATGFGFGYSPLFPGTPGTVPGVIIAWLLFPLGWHFQIGSTLVILLVGIWAANEAEQYFGHDARKIVIDEIGGVMVAYLFVPHVWQYYLLGFILFRIFDIWKPYPARNWENLKGGWGVMGDDFAVGVYVNIILQMFALFGVWI